METSPIVRRVLIGIAALVLACCSCACLNFLFGIPPSALLGHLYFARILANDPVGAGLLGGTGCHNTMTQDARRDAKQFGGAETRNVTLDVRHGTGSDHYYESVIITFEYRSPSHANWEPGEIGLHSNGDYWGFRSLCGNMKYTGP